MVQLRTKKSQFGSILEILEMKNVGKFYSTFGIFRGHLVHFPPFWYVCINTKFGSPAIECTLQPPSHKSGEDFTWIRYLPEASTF
jgi:hypothetical protein